MYSSYALSSYVQCNNICCVQDQYRFDTVLRVASGLKATQVSGARFKVSGSQGDSAPVEVTLEADDEKNALEWVR